MYAEGTLSADRDGWRTVCLRAGGGPARKSNARLGSPETQRARFPGGDRAVATTSGRHHGQAIRIDSFEVDDCLILGPPPGSVKALRRILATRGRCTNRERCPRIERVGDRLLRGGGGPPRDEIGDERPLDAAPASGRNHSSRYGVNRLFEEGG